jgi:hypothetical protein
MDGEDVGLNVETDVKREVEVVAAILAVGARRLASFAASMLPHPVTKFQPEWAQ